jgi:hypothetical protein
MVGSRVVGGMVVSRMVMWIVGMMDDRTVREWLPGWLQDGLVNG